MERAIQNAISGLVDRHGGFVYTSEHIGWAHLYGSGKSRENQTLEYAVVTIQMTDEAWSRTGADPEHEGEEEYGRSYMTAGGFPVSDILSIDFYYDINRDSKLLYQWRKGQRIPKIEDIRLLKKKFEITWRKQR